MDYLLSDRVFDDVAGQSLSVGGVGLGENAGDTNGSQNRRVLEPLAGSP